MESQGAWRRRARFALALVPFLAVTVVFALAAYRARHTTRDLVFVIVSYYLIALLLCCVAKLEQLRRDPAAAGKAVRRRVRIAAWAVSVALGTTFAARVAGATPPLALKLVVWGVAAVVLGLGFYFLFCSRDAERCHAEAEHGRGQADACLPVGKAWCELSPEEKV